MVDTEDLSDPGEPLPDTRFLANLLSQLAHPAATALTMEETCCRIVDGVRLFVPSQACWIVVFGRADGRPRLMAWQGIPPSAADDLDWLAPEAIGALPCASPGVWVIEQSRSKLGFAWPCGDTARLVVASMDVQGSHVGSIVVLLGREQGLGTQRELLLAALASQAGLVVRCADLLIASQELALREERARIAREIHDGVSQNLAILMLKMEVISRLADIDPPRMKAELNKVMSILESSVCELRRSVHALRSPKLRR